MANEKVFQSRIQLKHDIEENWSKATNFVPKVGEIIIYDIDENNSIARFKIGDGITNVNSLPFVSHHEVISYLPQDLTEEQKAQARENIGAGEPQIQADWNQNDENAPGYIANRTHYIDAINGTIVPNDTYSISGVQGVTINVVKNDFKMPVVGQTYQITYGDIVTTKVAYGEDTGNNVVWLGENYNEFKMRFSFNEINSKVEVYIETASAGQKIISITGPYLNKIYQLDKKYIPTATNNDIIQMLIDTEMISPATDEFSNLLTDENDSILVY